MSEAMKSDVNRIEPTYSCFDDAIEFIEQAAKDGRPETRDYLLVHALCVGSTGEPYAHAWVEHDGHCWDSGIINGEKGWYSVACGEYYAARRVVKVTRYSVDEMLAMNRRHRTYGPWESIYQMACRRAGEARRIVDVIAAEGSGR